MWTRISTSSKGGGWGIWAGSPDPYGICYWKSRGPATLAVTWGLRTSSGWIGICGADASALWGSRSSLRGRASSVGVREATSFFPMDSSKKVSQISSSSSCMRDARHFHRSQTAPHIVQGGAPDHSAQGCRALASTTVCSLCTYQMFLVHQNLYTGKHLGLVQLAAVGLLCRVVWVFDWTPPIGVSWCWLSPLKGGLWELMAKEAGRQGGFICSSVASPKK